MKRTATLIVALFAILLVFAGCSSQYTPDPAVEQYLNTGLTAEKAFEQLAKASYATIETRTDNGVEIGKTVTEVAIDVADKDNMSMQTHITYSGECVENAIVDVVTDLQKTDGTYFYNVVTTYNNDKKPSTQVQKMDEQQAMDLIKAVVYLDNGAYDEGGLYYGDYFMMIIYQYPPEFFYIDEQNLLVFDGKLYIPREDIGDVMVEQNVKINELGLIISESEKWQGVNSSLVVTSETTPHYEFIQSN